MYVFFFGYCSINRSQFTIGVKYELNNWIWNMNIILYWMKIWFICYYTKKELLLRYVFLKTSHCFEMTRHWLWRKVIAFMNGILDYCFGDMEIIFMCNFLLMFTYELWGFLVTYFVILKIKNKPIIQGQIKSNDILTQICLN